MTAQGEGAAPARSAMVTGPGFGHVPGPALPFILSQILHGEREGCETPRLRPSPMRPRPGHVLPPGHAPQKFAASSAMTGSAPDSMRRRCIAVAGS
jgi:hypothetical protein